MTKIPLSKTWRYFYLLYTFFKSKLAGVGMLLLRWCGISLLVGMVILLTFANLNQITNLWLILAMGFFGIGFLAYSEYQLQDQNRHSVFSDIVKTKLKLAPFALSLSKGNGRYGSTGSPRTPLFNIIQF